MSAPDSPSSKARPSLLSDTAKGAADGDSRILANLEGRVAARPGTSRRSRRRSFFGALAAIVCLSAFGAWQWQRVSSNDGGQLAGAQAERSAGKEAAPVPGASAPVLLAAASSAAAQAPKAASAMQGAPAVIVSENLGDSQGKASGARPASLATLAAPAARASDGERLSLALAEGARVPDNATATAAAPTRGIAAAKLASKRGVSHAQRVGDKERHAQRMAAASHRHAKDAKARAKSKSDDPDAALITALLARTKPYDANRPKQADHEEQPSTSHRSSSSQKAEHSPGAQTASANRSPLAAQVDECSKLGLLEAQACRWHVCADYWGKDVACPTSASAGPR